MKTPGQLRVAATSALSRRRIVVAITVLVLGLGWWFWPRGDARFVGNWSLELLDGSEFGRWELRRNGQATWSGRKDAGLVNGKMVVRAIAPQSAQWKVIDDSFVMGRPATRTDADTAAFFRWLRRYGPATNGLTDTGWDCRILSVEADLIQLEHQNPAPHKPFRFVIRRIPE